MTNKYQNKKKGNTKKKKSDYISNEKQFSISMLDIIFLIK